MKSSPQRISVPSSMTASERASFLVCKMPRILPRSFPSSSARRRSALQPRSSSLSAVSEIPLPSSFTSFFSEAPPTSSLMEGTVPGESAGSAPFGKSEELTRSTRISPVFIARRVRR